PVVVIYHPPRDPQRSFQKSTDRSKGIISTSGSAQTRTRFLDRGAWVAAANRCPLRRKHALECAFRICPPGAMNFLRLYGRVLALLGPGAKLGWALAGANVALGAAQFAEPVLFGRIVDTLVGAQARGGLPAWADLLPLLAAWAGFGLFTIG